MGDDILKAYAEELKTQTIYFVAVFCDLLQMQEREILRSDRAIGLSDDQIDRVHPKARKYDLTVDTTHLTPFDIAKQILAFVKELPEPQTFKTIQEKFLI